MTVTIRRELGSTMTISFLTMTNWHSRMPVRMSITCRGQGCRLTVAGRTVPVRTSKFTFVTGVTFTLEKARVICVRCSELTLTELELTEPVEVLVLLLPRVASRLPSRLLVAALPLVPVLPEPVAALLPAVPLVPVLPELAALPPLLVPVLPEVVAALPPVGAVERDAPPEFVPPELAPPPVPGEAVPLLPLAPVPAVPPEEPWARPWATLNERAAAAAVARSA